MRVVEVCPDNRRAIVQRDLLGSRVRKHRFAKTPDDAGFRDPFKQSITELLSQPPAPKSGISNCSAGLDRRRR